MAFDWQEYYELAKCLQGKTIATYSLEAAHRSAVSRAYYAAFCHARGCARLNFVPKKSASDHRGVRQALTKSPDPQLRAISGTLDRLRKSRNLCDYDDDVTDLSAMVSRALRDAQQVLNELG